MGRLGENIHKAQESGKDIYARDPATEKEYQVIYLTPGPCPHVEDIRGEDFYSVWTFGHGPIAIDRHLEPRVTFVSEPWELRSAMKRLNLEYILKEPAKSI